MRNVLQHWNEKEKLHLLKRLMILKSFALSAHFLPAGRQDCLFFGAQKLLTAV
jgi:hypothetical protein